MAEAFTGRDIFANGQHMPSAIGALFGEAFGVRPHGVVTEDASPDRRAGSWSESGRIAVHQLEPDGDFAFKVAIDLIPIDVGRFADLARHHGLTIARATNEADAKDWHYCVAFPDGSSMVRLVGFHETEEA